MLTCVSMRHWLIFIVCFLGLACQINAQHSTDLLQTGNDFLRHCDETRVNQKDAVSVAQYMRCMGYIQGFVEGHLAMQMTSSAKPTYCYPEDVEFGQVKRIVSKWLKDNPAKSNLPIAVVMEKSLEDTFPCNQ